MTVADILPLDKYDSILDTHDPLLDRGQLVALHILKAQVLSQAECLAINKVDAASQGILNPVIIAEQHEFLPHAKAPPPTPRAPIGPGPPDCPVSLSVMSSLKQVRLSFSTK